MVRLRHRDPNQTAKTYTDTRMLPLRHAIEKLTFHRNAVAKKDDTQGDAQTSVKTGQNTSSGVTMVLQGEGGNETLITLENTAFVAENQLTAEKEKWSERQDLNLRRLAPKASALPG